MRSRSERTPGLHQSCVIHYGQARLSLLLCLLVSALSPQAFGLDYTRFKLFELSTLAEVVLVGRIVDLDEENFEVQVVDRILGADVPDRLELPRFKDWTCAGRWAEYAEGQEVVLFLWRGLPLPSEQRTVGGPLKIMGGGGEGEMPRSGETVLMRGIRARDLPYEATTFGDRRAEGSTVSIEELKLAIRRLRSRTVWGPEGGSPYHGEIRSSVSPEELDRFAGSSKLARHLVEEMRSSEKFIGDRPPSRPALDPAPIPLAWCEEKQSGDPPSVVRASRQMVCTPIGDLDGDGIEEWGVGSRVDSAKGKRFGAFWILFLDENREVRESVEISEQAGSFPVGLSESALLGHAVAPLGDFDGDGIPDVAISAPAWNRDSNKQGGIWIMYLERSGQIRSTVEIGDALRASLPAGTQELGTALTSLGDLDGDGIAEIAIGVQVHTERRPFGPRINRVLIASVSVNGAVRVSRSLDAVEGGFAGTYNRFGCALANVGDVNGDGVTDLAVGDETGSDGGSSRGCVWVVFLDRQGSSIGKQKISDWAGGFDGLLLDRAYFGGHLAAPGDLDGDRVPDLLATSKGELWALFLNQDGTVRESVSSGRTGGGFQAQGDLGLGFSVEVRANERGARRILMSAEVRNVSQLWMLDLLPDGTLATQ